MPIVSVIIPTYNHRDYIVCALESVFAQTFKDFEVIVVNDGSPDNTALVLKPFVDEGRIRYVEQSNMGQAGARNRGLREARGAVLAFLDDDDLWVPDALERQLELLDANPSAVAVAGAAESFSSHGVRTYFPSSPGPVDFESIILSNPFVSPGMLLLRTDAVRAIGGFDPELWGTDDWDLWLRLSRTGHIFVGTHKVLLYRLHEQNASNRRDKMISNGIRTLEKALREVGSRRRSALHRSVYRGMIAGCGPLSHQAFWYDLVRGHPLAAVAALKVMIPFWKEAAYDPALIAAILRTAIPWLEIDAFRRWVRGRSR